jgi:cytosine/adenosine deaminase-related metal-dependent hydrolase
MTHLEKYIFCLEAIADSENPTETATLRGLEQLALQGIDSIYNYCDTIEELEERMGALVYDDEHFKEYEIIYLVMQGAENTIELNDYYYTLQEIAELFEGKMKGKIIHFANSKPLDLTQEEAQYFLDVSGARAVSGYGLDSVSVESLPLDQLFFALCQEEHDLKEVVALMHQKNNLACKALDFRLYY